MSIYKYRGLMVLVLWQTVPVPLRVDSTGQIQLSFGGATGQWEEVQTDCDGNVVHTEPHHFKGVGARMDAWPDRNLRVTGFGGRFDSEDPHWSGGYLGAMTALELQHFGIGAGIAHMPNSFTPNWPVGYLRIGNRDVLHFRTEITPPGPPMATAGTVRTGLGFGLGHQRRVNGQFGIALCHAPCDDDSGQASLYGELGIPVGSTVDLELKGLAGAGQHDPNTGLAVAARVHLAKPPRSAPPPEVAKGR